MLIDMIEEFQGEYRFLSNFYPSEFQFAFSDYGYDEGGIETFKTVEHFYQAMKAFTDDGVMFRRIIDCKSAGVAKRLGKEVDRSNSLVDWDLIKVPIMRAGIQKKFEIPELRDKLLSTRFIYLQEGNNWGDVFWGFDFKQQKGKNVLGQLLMEERKRIINTIKND